MKKKILIGISISIIFLVLAFHKANFREVWRGLEEANYLYIIPNILLLFLAMWFRAYRWRFMLKPVKEIRTKSLFASTMIGLMGNNLLPVRLGELLRAYATGEKEKISRSASFATIIVERVFDGFSLLVFFWLALVFSSFPEWVKKGANIVLVANLVSLVILVSLQMKPESTVRFVQKALSFLPKRMCLGSGELLLKFTSGLKVLRSWQDMLWIMFWSLVVWGILGVSNYFVLMAFGLYPPFWASFIILIFVSFAISLPSAPGYIGTFHWACVGALGLYGIAPDLAKAFSIVLWACQYFPITAVGLFYLKREHLSLKRVKPELKEDKKSSS